MVLNGAFTAVVPVLLIRALLTIPTDCDLYCIEFRGCGLLGERTPHLGLGKSRDSLVGQVRGRAHGPGRILAILISFDALVDELYPAETRTTMTPSAPALQVNGK